MRRKFNAAVLLGTISVITYFSVASIGGSSTPKGTFSFLHLAAYFGLSGAFLLHFHDTSRGHLEAFLAAGFFGVIIEVVQSGIPYRTFSFKDIAVNFAGASLILLDHRIGVVTKAVQIEDDFIEEIVQ